MTVNSILSISKPTTSRTTIVTWEANKKPSINRSTNLTCVSTRLKSPRTFLLSSNAPSECPIGISYPNKLLGWFHLVWPCRFGMFWGSWCVPRHRNLVHMGNQLQPPPHRLGWKVHICHMGQRKRIRGGGSFGTEGRRKGVKQSYHMI